MKLAHTEIWPPKRTFTLDLPWAFQAPPNFSEENLQVTALSGVLHSGCYSHDVHRAYVPTLSISGDAFYLVVIRLQINSKVSFSQKKKVYFSNQQVPGTWDSII